MLLTHFSHVQSRIHIFGPNFSSNYGDHFEVFALEFFFLFFPLHGRKECGSFLDGMNCVISGFIRSLLCCERELATQCREERKNLKSVSLKLLTINKGKKYL